MKWKLLLAIVLIFSTCKTEVDRYTSGVSPVVGNIIISELMINEADNEVDWIELYNTTVKAIELKGASISNGRGEEFIVEHSLIIPPDDYVVLVGGDLGEAEFSDALHNPVFEFPKEQFGLSKESDKVTLKLDDIIIDDVQYVTYNPGPATKHRGWQLEPNSMNHKSNDEISNWCYTILSDDYIYGDNRVASPGEKNLICTEVEFPYAYRNNQEAALITGIDFDATLQIAEEELSRKLVTSELTIWAIRDQQITPEIAKSIARLYEDNIVCCMIPNLSR